MGVLCSSTRPFHRLLSTLYGVLVAKIRLTPAVLVYYPRATNRAGERGTVTDNWQFQFLGYRSSVGELIVLTLMTLIVGLLADPWRRRLSRTSELCFDKLSSGFNKWRVSRIYHLEKRILYLESLSEIQLISRLIYNVFRWLLNIILLASWSS
jgi:hypothetical protein